MTRGRVTILDPLPFQLLNIAKRVNLVPHIRELFQEMRLLPSGWHLPISEIFQLHPVKVDQIAATVEIPVGKRLVPDVHGCAFTIAEVSKFLAP